MSTLVCPFLRSNSCRKPGVRTGTISIVPFFKLFHYISLCFHVLKYSCMKPYYTLSMNKIIEIFLFMKETAIYQFYNATVTLSVRFLYMEIEGKKFFWFFSSLLKFLLWEMIDVSQTITLCQRTLIAIHKWQ